MARMKYGQVVRVTTKQMGGGEPMIVLYAVAAENPVRAEEIVRIATNSTDEQIEAVGPIRWDVLTDRFGLTDGQFTHL
jgi:hypothetical protein